MTRAILLAVCLVIAHAPIASSQTSGDRRADDRVVRIDSSLVLVPARDRAPLALRLEQNTARPLSNYLTSHAQRFVGLERYELSGFDCAVSGAGMGFTYGLVAAAAGMTAGVWDERAGWYIAGAAALTGAIFGAKKADDPGFRVRLRWDAPK